MTFIVTAGQVAQLDRAPALPVPSVRLADDFVQDYAAIWRTNQQVRTVVDFLARNIAQIGLHAFERVSDVSRKRLSDHPLSQLLAKPNPRTTRYRMIDSLVHDLGIYDNAIWLKVKADGQPQALLRLPPQRVRPIGDDWAWPEAYRFTGSRGHRDFSPDDVIHFRGYNADDARWGMSPIETLRRILAEDHHSGLMREQLNRNGARFAGWISRPSDAPQWSDTAARQFAADFQSAWSGSGSKAGGTPVLEDGMTYKAEGVTPKDLQYLEVRKLTREEVASAFHIPPPLIGILDHATFSNIRQQHEQLYQDTLGPWLQMIAEELALQLIPDFAGAGNVYVEFNIKDKLKGSEDQFDKIQTAVGGPWMTPNEARARENLEPVDGGDSLLRPLNMGDSAAPEIEPVEPVEPAKSRPVLTKAKAEPSDAEKVLRRFFRRQRTDVLAALGGKSEWWDGDRWNRELTDELYALAMRVTSQVAGAVLAGLEVEPDRYDAARTKNFLRAVAKSRAARINDATHRQLVDALIDDEPERVFDAAEGDRATAAAVTLTTTLAGFATVEAATQAGGESASKTWRTTSGNSRSAHAAMNGETVPVGDKFSNGAMFPGDAVLGADGVAGCECDVEVSI